MGGKKEKHCIKVRKTERDISIEVRKKERDISIEVRKKGETYLLR